MTIRGSRERTVAAGREVILDASETADPDDDALSYEWCFYPEAGSWKGSLKIENASGNKTTVTLPGEFTWKRDPHCVERA